MPSRFKKANDFKIAFVLTEELLRDGIKVIHKELTSTDPFTNGTASEPLHYNVELIESGEFTTESLEEVIALQNSGSKRIRAITISTGVWIEPTVYLRFRDADNVNNVSYSVSGDEKQIFFISERLDDFVRRTRAWYSRIAHLDVLQMLFGLLAVSWFLALIVASALALAGAYNNTPSSTSGESILINTAFYATLLFLVALGTGLNRFRAWLFPAGIFAIGDQKERASKLRFWRGFFEISLVVAVVVNLVTTLILG